METLSQLLSPQSALPHSLAALGLALCVMGGAAAAWGTENSSIRRLLHSFSCGSLQQPSSKQPSEDSKPPPRTCSANSLAPAAGWVAAIEQLPDTERVMDASMLLEDSHPILQDDHLFSDLLAQGTLQDLTGYFNSQQQRFYAVISLGRAVCGFPRIVHGGLTAAIIDETLGGLMFALKQSSAIQLPGPMFTVQLEVTYKQKIDASAQSAVLCTAEVESLEGRKLWMKATVRDGPEGTVFASARALFVSPKPREPSQDPAAAAQPAQ